MRRKTGEAAQHSAIGGRARDPIVQIFDLHKDYGSLSILKGVDLEVRRGEVLCVLGRSGSGKSTMLRCINHLEKPTHGAVVVNGEVVGYHERAGKLHELHPKQVARQRADIGMVFQSFNLFPHLTVLENLIEARNSAGCAGRRISSATTSWSCRASRMPWPPCS